MRRARKETDYDAGGNAATADVQERIPERGGLGQGRGGDTGASHPTAVELGDHLEGKARSRANRWDPHLGIATSLQRMLCDNPRVP